MSIRSKIILSITAGAVIAAPVTVKIAVSGAKSVIVVAALVAAFCAAAGVIGLLVAGSIAKPLDAAAGMLREMGRGRLGCRLNMTRNDEIGDLAKALDALADNLSANTVGTIKKIAAGDLSAEIEPRDDRDEINGALKQAIEHLRERGINDGMILTAMIRRNADNANRAKLLAAEASVGNATMKRLAKVINGIKASSDNNAKIIKTINYMAMRARCLAFNAAIEAAHAGEAGKGFAFVAGEARNFAARCAAAAKNIADMIEDSAKDVDDGVKITEEAVRAVDDIVDRIDENINRHSPERANVAADGLTPGDGNGLCAPVQRGQRSLSAPRNRYAAFPYKKIYSAATLALWAPMRAAGAEEAFTIDDCEMWR